jgi:RNA polymerase sigma-70 factor (sigma-E family)
MTGVPAVVDAAGGSVKASERGQFDQFVASRWAGLVRLAYGLTGDRWLAEDLAQTALASAYAAWWRVSRADDPDAYVRRILINASNSRFRRRRPAEQPQPIPDIAGAVPDHATVLGERSALMAALAGLPPRQRAVIVLRFWEDLTDAQTAVILGCSASTVRSQIARALAKLRLSPALAEGEPS